MLVSYLLIMGENLLIPLPGFTLPTDFPSRVGFTAAVDEHLERMRTTGRYEPGQFFGYYFHGSAPVGLSGSWTVALEESAEWHELHAALERLTSGQFGIMSAEREAEPDFLLVHDRWDGACWLWKYSFGMRFVSATEAMVKSGDGGGGDDDAQGGGWDRKLSGP